MPPEALDFRFRTQLTELMDEPCSREVLRACLRDIARTNRWTLGYRPTMHWLNTLAAGLKARARPIRILDVGCGYGDGLRRMERWAERRGIDVELTGLDLNPDATAIAAEASPANSSIEWVSGDIFDYVPPKPIDLVVSALFTHHLAEDDVVRFLRWMEKYSELGWFINDLSRAAIPYYFFRAFSKLAGLHGYVQNDGPISIARAFVHEDWRRMCAAAGLFNPEIEIPEIEIQAFKPARLCVARRKLP
jgi:SAM-dependent methyltransferase